MRIVKKDEKDRRSRYRFPIHRELRYKLLDEHTVAETGLGNTLNIGSGGLAFRTDRDLKINALIEMSISWPMLLDDNCPMRLVVFGRVLRSVEGLVACSVDKYEFRTQARTVLAVAPPRNDSKLQRWAEGLRRESRAATA
jgi:hypothetical protein